MKIIITEDYKGLSIEAAKLVEKQVKQKPNSILGLATGSTALGMYEELVTLFNQNQLDFSEITTFNLDEYIGLPAEHNQSYAYYMKENFFSKVNVKEKNINFLSHKLEKENSLNDFDISIEKVGGIDLQVLGIGQNGHIGFNEPHEYLHVNTHVVELAEKTIEANSRFFKDKEEVPKKAITMGVGSILKAKKILLLASGIDKAQAIFETLNGKVSTSIPASLLQIHPNVTMILDVEAASLLKEPHSEHHYAISY